MNLQSKKARIPIAALGVTALIAAAGAFATPAFAAGETLAFGPTGTTATIVDSATTPGTAAGLTYGAKVTGASGGDPSYLGVISAPTGASLYSERVPGNGAPTANATFANVTSTVANTQVNISTTAGSTAATLSLSPENTGTVVDYSLAGALIKIGATEYATVATHVSGTTSVVLSAPAINTQATVALMSGGAASANNFFVPTATATTAVMPGYVAGDNVYFGAVVPGDYTYRVFQDHNGNRVYDSAQDDSTPVMTLHVKDVTGNTVATSDDLDFGLTAPATGSVGQTVLATATMGGLTPTDTRGAHVLADKVALATSFAYGGTAVGQANTGAPTYATSYTRASGVVTTAGTVLTSATLGTASASVTTTVSGNGATGVTLAATNVVGSVATDGSVATQTNVKTGTAAVTYTMTVTNSVTPTDIVGKTVFFTLGGADAASLTTDGTTVDAPTHVYSATTVAGGVASLKVTDGAATPTTYTVAAKSNNISGTTRTALYADSAATTATVTNTATELTPTTASGVSVTLKGSLMDQFGGMFVPSLLANQIVVVSAPAGVTTICNAPLSAGNFSCAYTPSVTPVAGTSTTFRFAYTGGASPSVDGAINWASSTPAGTVTLTSPNAVVAGANLSTSTLILPGQTSALTGATAGVDADDFGDVNGQVTGTVLGTDNQPLAFKSVTITGGAGVYFRPVLAFPGTPVASDDLKTSITVVTNNLGVFGGAYAIFTKAGTAAVTATADSVSDASAVTTDTSADPYVVTINDAVGAPGSTLIITGTIKDAFGNPAVGEDAALDIGTSTLGAFTGGSSSNANGVFTATFISGSNKIGVADLTATLFQHAGPVMTTNPVANTHWLTDAGLVVADGVFQDVGKLTISNTSLTLVAPTKLISGASGVAAHLTGTFIPSTTVEIWGKPSGATVYSFMDTASTNATGTWTASETIKKSTFFIARANGISSGSDQAAVYSKVSISAKALGHGKVSLYANGDPNAKATIVFYRSVAGADPRLKTVTSSSFGSATVTVSLPKGTRKVYAVYTAPGTGKGSSKLLSVKVK